MKVSGDGDILVSQIQTNVLTMKKMSPAPAAPDVKTTLTKERMKACLLLGSVHHNITIERRKHSFVGFEWKCVYKKLAETKEIGNSANFLSSSKRGHFAVRAVKISSFGDLHTED